MAQQQKFLSEDEVEICQKLASQEDLDGKRAKALLAINDGDTHRVAAEKAGLSGGQMMYLSRIYRNKRMDIFSQQDEKNDSVDVIEKEEFSKEPEESKTIFEVDDLKKKFKKEKKKKKKDKTKKEEKKSKKKKDKKKSDKRDKKGKKKKKSKKKK